VRKVERRLCEYCFKATNKNERRFCSRRCWMMAYAKTCERCGKKRPSEAERFCSRECHLADRRGDFAEKFWALVQRTDTCWTWKGQFRNTGYGNVNINGIHKSAHRVAYQLSCGSITEGLFVLHRCDNRACVRPDHLFLGTQQDNIDDACRKGRTARGDRNSTRTKPDRHPRGVRHGMHKLTDDDVRSIRERSANGENRTHLGEYFGVTARAIDFVVSRKHWKHVE
jgi:hypothetical protein